MPTDEQILVTMTIVYRKANQMQALAEAYAAASAARPKDGSLLQGVFANHVRHVAVPVELHIMHSLFVHDQDSILLPLRLTLRCCLIHVPDCCVVCRSFNFSGQQQQAMKLHKLAGSNDDQYIWWSIVSLGLQAKAASQGTDLPQVPILHAGLCHCSLCTGTCQTGIP